MSYIFTTTKFIFLILTIVALSNCGGGSSSNSSSSTSNGGSTTPPPTDENSLRIHLSVCPDTLTINEQVSCMVGLYEGKTTDTEDYCAFTYGSDGMANYIAGTQSLRVYLNLLSSGAVFEKKPGNNSAGFSISWAIGIASGNDMNIYYQDSSEPLSANGLLIKPETSSMPACLVQNGPTPYATGSEDTTNYLGRTWASPHMLNGSGAIALFSDQPAFDAGLADDGRAFITFRQPDMNGKMAVYVVEGHPGATGESATWTAPQQLDANEPLLAGNFKPRIAVSTTGHAVVAWLSERPCEADSNMTNFAGKTCRYLYASRRLASDSDWEPAQRVRYSPNMAAQDHYARINARGDIVLAFPSFDSIFSGTRSTLAIRNAEDATYQAVELNGFWSNPVSTTPFGETILSEVDDAGNLFVAGDSSGVFDIAQLNTTTLLAPYLPTGVDSPVISTSGVQVFELRTSGNGFAAFTWRKSNGSRANPDALTVYSPDSQAWLAPYDITAYSLWGDTALVGTDNFDGEFLLYSGCKVTAWLAGTWGATQDLPSYCGRDQNGGVYALNRNGDYVGINWAGKPGQWGYYSRAQDELLKGAPGENSPVSGDFVLGTESNLFGAAPTQLLLSNTGIALAVTTNTYTELPSIANTNGVSGGTANKLWAVYLK